MARPFQLSTTSNTKGASTPIGGPAPTEAPRPCSARLQRLARCRGTQGHALAVAVNLVSITNQTACAYLQTLHGRIDITRRPRPCRFLSRTCGLYGRARLGLDVTDVHAPRRGKRNSKNRANHSSSKNCPAAQVFPPPPQSSQTWCSNMKVVQARAPVHQFAPAHARTMPAACNDGI